MKYKVGDRVRIKSLDWYNQNRAIDVDYVLGKNDRRFARQMSKWCSQVATITKLAENIVRGPYYELDIDEGFYSWDDWMFEDNTINLVEILKDAPQGMELYSVAHGVVKLHTILKDKDNRYPIGIENRFGVVHYLTTKGQLFDFDDLETILFPSKENRDWSTFETLRWRAERHSYYYYVSAYGGICDYTDDRSSFDDNMWNVGNYFKTEEEAKNSKFYKVFHEEEG
jgi:hypothetical protein